MVGKIFPLSLAELLLSNNHLAMNWVAVSPGEVGAGEIEPLNSTLSFGKDWG